MANTTAALESDGVTIVPGVLSELEQKQMRDGYWDFFAKLVKKIQVSFESDIFLVP